MLMLLLKERQLQDGASWDSIVTIAVGVLLIGGAGLVIALVGSRLLHVFRTKKHRAARRHR
jgi:hypothetical protein